MMEDDEKAKNPIISSTYTIVATDGPKMELSAQLRDQAERARDLFEEPRGENTKRAYDADWRGFEAWSNFNKLPPEQATPEVVALYFAYLRDEGLAVHTIERAYCGIARRLKTTNPELWPSSGVRPEVIRLCLSNLRRQNTRPVDRKAPLTAEQLKQLANHEIGSGLEVIRNKAMLLIGFGAALRRSELVGLNREHIELVDGNMRLFLPKRKTDQEGKGTWIGIMKQDDPNVCAVVALSRWLKIARSMGYPIDRGPIFRPIQGKVIYPTRLHPKQVVRVVKLAAETLGLDPKRFAGHSLRAGLATSAAQQGVSLVDIQAQTGHASLKQLGTYIRPASVFVSNATRNIFSDKK